MRDVAVCANAPMTKWHSLIVGRMPPLGRFALQIACRAAGRKLHEVAQAGRAPIAEDGLKQIAAPYRIEKDIRGLTSEARLAGRQV